LPGDDRGIATRYRSIGEVDPNATIATEIPWKITRDGGRATKERSAIVDARIILLVKQVVDEKADFVAVIEARKTAAMFTMP